MPGGGTGAVGVADIAGSAAGFILAADLIIQAGSASATKTSHARAEGFRPLPATRPGRAGGIATPLSVGLSPSRPDAQHSQKSRGHGTADEPQGLPARCGTRQQAGNIVDQVIHGFPSEKTVGSTKDGEQRRPHSHATRTRGRRARKTAQSNTVIQVSEL